MVMMTLDHWLGCQVEKRHFQVMTALSPSNGCRASFSPWTAPENILIFPPTSEDIEASDAVRPRMRCRGRGGSAVVAWAGCSAVAATPHGLAPRGQSISSPLAAQLFLASRVVGAPHLRVE